MQSSLYRWSVLLLLTLTGCAAGYRVTGADPQTAVFSQSETAADTSYSGGVSIIVVTYNDGTDPGGKVAYTSSSRLITAGASLLGWSYSTDDGKTWTYGGRMPPPEKWAVLWGDPAITTSRHNYSVVFISSLAIPVSKMPAQGITGSVIITGGHSYIGGACIVRSTDGGKTFAHHQCVANTTKNSVPQSELGHFYDGGSMAASQDGSIYAAYNDVTENAIDVWRAPNDGAQFVKIADPFPGMSMGSHPRLRASPYDDSVYVAAQSSKGEIYLNRYRNGAWGRPITVGAAELYPCIPLDPGACDPSVSTFSTLNRVRTGPQFSYDVGFADDPQGRDAIRFLFTRQDPRTMRFYLQAKTCDLQLNDCYSWLGKYDWGTVPSQDPPIDAFNPNVAAWRGFIGLPPRWMSTFSYRYGIPATGVYVARAPLLYLSNGQRLFFPIDNFKNMPVCSDRRGYWGDYDALIIVGFRSNYPQWLGTVSDSLPGCTTRSDYTSDPLHVRGLIFQ